MGYSNWLAASYGTTIKVSQLVWATKQNRIEMNEEYKNGLKEPPTKIIIDNYLIETIAYNLNYISLFKESVQFYNKYAWKINHLVNSARIRTQDLLFMSLLPLPLDLSFCWKLWKWCLGFEPLT